MIRPVLAAGLQETLQASADGWQVIEIARRRYVAEDTVKQRLRTLYSLLGAENRAHAVSIGYRLGVLDARPLPIPDCVLAEGVPLDCLVTAREKSGMTQRAMAIRLGVSPVWLCHREAGRYLFPMRVVLRYAELVGIDLDDDLPALLRDAA